MGVTSLVLGIMGIVMSPSLGAGALVLAIPGAAFGGIALSKAIKANAKKGMAIAGLVTSLVGLAACLGGNVTTDDELSTKTEEETSYTSKELTDALDEAKSELKKGASMLKEGAQMLKSIKID